MSCARSTASAMLSAPPSRRWWASPPFTFVCISCAHTHTHTHTQTHTHRHTQTLTHSHTHTHTHRHINTVSDSQHNVSTPEDYTSLDRSGAFVNVQFYQFTRSPIADENDLIWLLYLIIVFDSLNSTKVQQFVTLTATYSDVYGYIPSKVLRLGIRSKLNTKLFGFQILQHCFSHRQPVAHWLEFRLQIRSLNMLLCEGSTLVLYSVNIYTCLASIYLHASITKPPNAQ